MLFWAHHMLYNSSKAIGLQEKKIWMKTDCQYSMLKIKTEQQLETFFLAKHPDQPSLYFG